MFTVNNLLNKRERNKSVGHAGRISNHRRDERIDGKCDA